MGVDIAADAGELSVMRAQARERRVADNRLGHSTSPWLGDASVAEGQELLVKIARARPRRLLLCKCCKSLPPARTVASHCRMARKRANAVCQHDQRCRAAPRSGGSARRQPSQHLQLGEPRRVCEGSRDPAGMKPAAAIEGKRWLIAANHPEMDALVPV